MAFLTPPSPAVEVFFDPDTGSFSYVLHGGDGSDCAVIDPVLNFDPKAGRTSTGSADAIEAFIRRRGLVLRWLLETHVHADHLSAAAHLQRRLGGTVAVGEGILRVQGAFEKLFGPMIHSGSEAFGRLLKPDDRIEVSPWTLHAMHVPGHTPADMAYVVEDTAGTPTLAFVGDTLFMPDLGSARCDFPGGSARALYRSARRLLALPADTVLLMCHDYPPATRAPCSHSTVAEQRLHNIHLRDAITEDEFVDLRERRDATLAMPVLLLPAIQVNLRAGELPAPEANGIRYLKIPVNAL